MAAHPPPEGLTEEDYDSIHAAVVETVRGRWFLAEYARRSHVDEVREMLDAIKRLETAVTSGHALPPPAGDASPHLRLLTQRAGEIAASLSAITEDLRDSGADPYLCDDLESQIRALAGLPKAGVPRTQTPPIGLALERELAGEAPRPQLNDARQDMPPEKRLLEEPARHLLQSSALEPLAVPQGPPNAALSQAFDPMPSIAGPDPRLIALAALDRLSLTEKLGLFR